MKFSIIIPAYNSEKYIRHCIDSVISQNFPASEYEVIVVDDCSKDNQRAVISSYTENYPPSIKHHKNRLSNSLPEVILIKHAENKRQGGARNTGIKAARGEWILFVDSDDYWCRNDVLQQLSDIIDKYQEASIIESIEHIDVPDWNDIEVQSTPPTIARKYKGVDFITKSGYFSSYVWRSAYRRSLIYDIPFREHVFFEDSDWRLKAVMSANEIIAISFPFYAYVNNMSSTIRNADIKVFYENINSNLLLLELFLSSANADLRTFGLSRIKSNILSWLKISKNYKIRDSASVLKYAAKSKLFDTSLYQLSGKEKCIFKFWQFSPLLLSAGIKYAVLIRRKLRKLIAKSR